MVADPSCMILIRIRIHRPRMTSLDGKSVRAVTSGYGGWRFSPLKYSISNVLAKKIKVSSSRVPSVDQDSTAFGIPNSNSKFIESRTTNESLKIEALFVKNCNNGMTRAESLKQQATKEYLT